MAFVQLFDEYRLFSEYCAAFAQTFLDAGGAVGAAGNLTKLQGHWIPEGILLLVNFMPSVEKSVEFFFSGIETITYDGLLWCIWKLRTRLVKIS